MSSILTVDDAIARVASLRRCPACGHVSPATVDLCPKCTRRLIVVPHDEWGRDVKRFLSVRAIERKWCPGMNEQALWEMLLFDNYRGVTVGEGRDRRTFKWAVTFEQVFPVAVDEAHRWVAAGRPTRYTL